MQAVRCENFALSQWKAVLYDQIRRRYLGAAMEDQGPHVSLVRLNTLKQWSEEDQAFWADLKGQGVIQRWEPLESVPPVARHNKAVFEDIGYRVGSGERLTARQQEALFSQLLNLELRAQKAEHEAKAQGYRAQDAEEHATKAITIYNDIIAMLDVALKISVSGDNQSDGWMVEDRTTGQILVRGVSIPEAYRVALLHRQLAKALED